MDTTERMMIMGMCLQGLLANPSLTLTYSTADNETAIQATVRLEIARNIKLAHLYADALDPPPEVTAAVSVAQLTRVAYEAIRAADADGAGLWVNFDSARTSMIADDSDRMDGVFERVSRWYADPTGYPETTQDRIIAAIVAASRD